jgi:SAM-dependent methyltransferase
MTSLPNKISSGIKSGEILAGDSFSGNELRIWYEQEKEAYYAAESQTAYEDPWYKYMRYTNEKIFFRIIPKNLNSGSIMFLGAGSGIEANNFYQLNPDWKLNFIESSDDFKSVLLSNFIGSDVIDSSIEGKINLESNSNDIVCAFCVLHHIANVTDVINEIYRVTKPGGLFFVREPCSSMGDWRFQRSATPNERGISKKFMIKAATEAGFNVKKNPVSIVFEPINKLLSKIGILEIIPLQLIYFLDRLLSWILSFNDLYWRDRFYKKFGPSSYAYIFQKPK